ncbi:ATP-binding cassette domain-containing protein, partial [Lactococcus lactis]
RFPHQKLMQQRLSKEGILFIEELMRETKIWDIRESKFSELSGGQKQRVFITMILAQDSELILLDAPTTYLDLAHQ